MIQCQFIGIDLPARQNSRVRMLVTQDGNRKCADKYAMGPQSHQKSELLFSTYVSRGTRQRRTVITSASGWTF